MANEQRKKGGGSKSYKLPGAASRKLKRIRSHHRLPAKKDRNVLKSSHGKFKSVAELEVHRASLFPARKAVV